MSSKTYILQKDLPDAKKGDPYVWDTVLGKYRNDENPRSSDINQQGVENNPDWFLQEPVTWTINLPEDHPDLEKVLVRGKVFLPAALTQGISEDKPERIEVSVLQLFNENQGRHSYQFTVEGCIPFNKYLKIKEAIERVLNDDEAWQWKSNHPIGVSVNIQELVQSSILSKVMEYKSEEVKKQNFDAASEWRKVERFLKGELPA